MTQERKERSNRKGLVTVSEDFKVNTVLVVKEGEEGDCGVDGNHKQDPYDTGALSARMSSNCP